MTTLKHQSRWYVYELVDPRDQAVFYVGKGAGKRVDAHGMFEKTQQNQGHMGKRRGNYCFLQRRATRVVPRDQCKPQLARQIRVRDEIPQSGSAIWLPVSARSR